MNIYKQALRERYSPQPVPKCRICGDEMTVQRIYGSHITYGCTGATYDDKGCHYAEGRSIADDHYAQSRVTVVDVSDPDVLALLDDLEAAERRIAELEARTVTPPKNNVANVGDSRWMWYQRDLMWIETIRAAGIGVKQQQDSVDSDVGSRNQPGTVTAIYIGAGDFVKVKGQVFEVEETDFDDHDVTLWFVGGNALKCSAGCPVEVVSAQVKAAADL
ncbi:ead/Ea22-like family protein, partial [Salmonella enterica subsp. enterica serovar Kokomlemle]